jgi:hypothetical protein
MLWWALRVVQPGNARRPEVRKQGNTLCSVTQADLCSSHGFNFLDASHRTDESELMSRFTSSGVIL